MNFRTHTTEIHGRFWLQRNQRNFLGCGRIELLETIAQLGTIAQAAKAMNMSYKAAWDAIDAMNNLSPQLLVKRTVGGKGGGGTIVTAYGQQLILWFKQLEVEHYRFLERLSEQFEQLELDPFHQLLRNLNMYTSARNQFVGSIVSLKEGAVNTEIVIQLKGDDQIVATVTCESAKRLGLKVGKEVYALIKASHIILMPPNPEFEVSARNRLCGKVTRVILGPVNAEVTLQLPGGNTLAATVTQEAVADLGIQVGNELCGIFKAPQVILAVKKGG